MESSVPALRVRSVNQAPVRPDGAFVLYWLVSNRRLEHNFALDRAVEWCRELQRPLLILEAFRSGHRWAAQRFHHFVLSGMAERQSRLADTGVAYFPYVEPRDGAGKGLLEALGEGAAVVVTDEFPAFFIPRMIRAAGQKLPVRLEAVDANGLLPLEAGDRTFTVAHSFRRHLQKVLPEHLPDAPLTHPLKGLPAERRLSLEDLPPSVLERWAPASADLLALEPSALARIPVDGAVGPVAGVLGTREAALGRLDRFLEERMDRYPDDRNSPDRHGASELSPWLHWGVLSSHEIFRRMADREGWSPARLAPRPHGKREGWWGMSPGAEAFLDELVTWREIGYNMCWREPDRYDRYESLPEWARTTLAEHASDPRPHLYDLEGFDRARTHDPLWNAAQRQLRREGIIHNYLRMLWGKKILEWSASPREALEIMVELNNRYALDGCNPNSWSGIFWVLGRYDRGWPERAIYGKVRSMSSDSTRRKVELKGYLRRFGPGTEA